MSAMTLPLTVADLLQRNKTAARHVDEGHSQSDVWSDEALVDAIVKRGSDWHFRTLLSRYKVRVHQIALSVLGPTQQAQAEDVAQEVFISIYGRLDQFRGDCKFSTWLYRLAVNAAIDFRRSASRHGGVSLDDAVLPGVPFEHPGNPVDSNTRQQIRKAMLDLPESQRMMVHLFYWLDLKVREIAEILDCPEGTIKVYLQRARKELAKSLEHIQHD